MERQAHLRAISSGMFPLREKVSMECPDAECIALRGADPVTRNFGSLRKPTAERWVSD
jgi:hypothetical protein